MFVLLSVNAFGYTKMKVELMSDNPGRNAGFYLAYMNGYFAQAELLVNFISPDSGADADISVGSLDILKNISHDSDLRVLRTVFQTTPCVLVHSKVIDIAKKNIDGIRAGFIENGLCSLFLEAYLKYNGIKYEQVIFSSIDKAVGSIKKQDVDLISADFFSMEEQYLQDASIVVKNPKNEGFLIMGDTLYTNNTFYSANPKSVERFIFAAARGWDSVFADIDGAVDMLFKKFNKLNLPKSEFSKRVKKEILLAKHLMMYPEVHFGHINVELWVNTYKKMFKSGIVPHDIDVKDFIKSPEIDILKENNKLISVFSLVSIIITMIFTGGVVHMLLLKKAVVNAKKELTQKNMELEDINKGLEITIQKTADRILQQERALIEQKRFSEVSDIMSAVAHRWRQPLNILGVYIQDVLETYDSLEINRAYLENFERTSMKLVHEMSDTIDDFRLYFTPDEKPTKFNAVAEVINLLKLMSSKLNTENIELEFRCVCPFGSCENFKVLEHKDCREEYATLVGFNGEFRHAMLNIIGNSVEAIKSRSEQKPKSIYGKRLSVNIGISEDRIQLFIKDTGAGFSEVDIEKAFDPYYTTKEEGKGTGMGLFAARMCFVEHMEGDIKLYNDSVSGGAITEISLPRHS